MKLKTLHHILLVNVLVSITTKTVLGKECKQDDLCSCTFEDGTKIDITSLGNNDGTPRFADVKSPKDGNIYSYNPCTPFKEAACTQDAAACVQDPTQTQSAQIGDASKAAFKYDKASKNVDVAYTSGTVTDLRVTQVALVCDEGATDPVFTADGAVLGGEFPFGTGIVIFTLKKQFTVKTVCACPDGCTASGPSGGSGISGGTVIIIAFFCIIVMYFSVGVVVQKVLRKKEGKELIPNSSFWFGIPSNIKAGFIFLLGRCIPRFRETKFDAI